MPPRPDRVRRHYESIPVEHLSADERWLLVGAIVLALCSLIGL